MVNPQPLMKPMSASLEVAYAAVRDSLKEYQRTRSLQSIHDLGQALGVLQKKIPKEDWLTTCRSLGINRETARVILVIYKRFQHHPSFRSSQERIPIGVLYQLTRLPYHESHTIFTQKKFQGIPLERVREEHIRIWMRARNTSLPAQDVQTTRDVQNQAQAPPLPNPITTLLSRGGLPNTIPILSRQDLSYLIHILDEIIMKERDALSEYLSQVANLNASDAFLRKSWGGQKRFTFPQMITRFHGFIQERLSGAVDSILFYTIPHYVEQFTDYLIAKDRDLQGLQTDKAFQHDAEMYLAFKLLECLYTVLTSSPSETLQQYPILLDEVIVARIHQWGAMRETRKLLHEAYGRAAKSNRATAIGYQIVSDLKNRLARLRRLSGAHIISALNKLRSLNPSGQ